MREVKIRRISTKLILVGIFVMLISVIPIGIVSYYYAEKGMVNMTRIQLSVLAQAEAQKINDSINRIIHDAGFLSSEAIISDEKSSPEDKLKELSSFQTSNQQYNDISIADKAGNVIADTIGARENVSDREWFVEIKDNKKDTYLELRKSKNLGGIWVLAVSKAVKDANGNLTAVIVLRQNMSNFFEEYIQNTSKSYEQNGFKGYPWLIDNTGLLIGHVNEKKRFTENLSSTGSVDLKEIVGKMIGQKTGNGHYVYEGVSKSVGYAPIPANGLNWSLGITFDDEALYKYINRIRNTTIFVGLLIGMAICIVAVFVAKWFSKPIVTLKEMMERAKDGDLTVKSSVISYDEIGDMTEAFNNMIQNQRTVISGIRATAETVAASTQQMSAVTEQIASGSQNQSASAQETLSSMEELDASIQNISKNVQEVTMNISEVSILVGIMQKSVEDVSLSIMQVNNETLNTINAAQSGQEAINKSRQGMDRINKTVGNLISAIKGLGKSALNIGDIVDVIDDIAEQTNLLALNAAIEAARAGEQGKGFAVVASAIRNLAEKSGEATKEITKLIRKIQEEVSQAVETAKEGEVEVRNGVEITKETERVLTMIKEAVDNTANEVKKVIALTEAQDNAIKDVVEASENINELSQTMAATVEEQTAASSEVVKAVGSVSQSSNMIALGTSEMAGSTEGLAKEAQKLSNMVSNFRIN